MSDVEERKVGTLSQYLIQSAKAQKWAQEQVQKLLDEGYEEIAPGIYAKDKCIVEF